MKKFTSVQKRLYEDVLPASPSKPSDLPEVDKLVSGDTEEKPKTPPQVKLNTDNVPVKMQEQLSKIGNAVNMLVGLAANNGYAAEAAKLKGISAEVNSLALVISQHIASTALPGNGDVNKDASTALTPEL